MSMRIGIIGLGNFGQLVAKFIPKNFEVLGHDPKSGLLVSGVKMVDLETAAKADVLILAITLETYPNVLKKLRVLLPSATLLVDVCSVKVMPQKLIKEHLPKHQNILMTHPMFGPQTIEKGLRGNKVLVTEARGSLAASALKYCQEKLGLVTQEITAEEHDKAMAHVHAITSFLGHGLAKLPIDTNPPASPVSYQNLLKLVHLDSVHTKELYRTIELGNPFAEEARQALLAKLSDIEHELQNQRQTFLKD